MPWYFSSKTLFCYWKLVFKQETDNPMSKDPAPYQANLSLYFLNSTCVQQSISKGSQYAYKFHGTARFIDDLCTINDDCEFSSSYKYI